MESDMIAAARNFIFHHLSAKLERGCASPVEQIQK
jgi:hypothetical protein